MRIRVKKGWKETITDPEKVADVVQAILAAEDEHDRDKEHFWVFGLTGSNGIKFIDLAHLGTMTTCQVHPREVYRLAVMKGAARVILAHNHPSGSASPSQEDTRLTLRLADAGKILGIEVLDHVVVGDAGYFSFKEGGML